MEYNYGGKHVRGALEVADDVSGGKRWRPVLVFLIAEALGGKKELAMPMAYLCEIVHNGTLCVDDIEDDSKMRRGIFLRLPLPFQTI